MKSTRIYYGIINLQEAFISIQLHFQLCLLDLFHSFFVGEVTNGSPKLDPANLTTTSSLLEEQPKEEKENILPTPT